MGYSCIRAVPTTDTQDFLINQGAIVFHPSSNQSSCAYIYTHISRSRPANEYMYTYIHPELRIGDCPSGTGKGSRAASEGAEREQGRVSREHYEVVQRRGRWEPEMTSSVSA